MENVGFIIRKTNGKRKNQELLDLGLKDYVQELHSNVSWKWNWLQNWLFNILKNQHVY